ncbi:Proton pump-interactor [Parasponia andersonii]|uniref:Proton pump-interactor n=1 Tax=Parasponia andersonii TaxID=3476 RepID=A0A2P5AU20_PARAD|nr:Proton pump-interactor [Parasponia andersonii]
MGVEVAGFEMVQGPLETVTGGDNSVLHEKENGKLDQGLRSHESIQFGSHGEEPVKEDESGVSEASFPKDAVDEWPAPKQIHSFYFVRYRSYDDPKIKVKIDQAAVEIEKKTQARFKITEQLKAKRSDRAELISQIKALKDDNRQIRTIVDEKIKEIEPLQQALGKLRNANSANWGICSSEEELNSVIHSLQYRIQHESIPLAEEKQILREIKQLESTREKVVANDAMRAKIQDSMVQKEALQDQLIGGDLDGVRKEQQVVRAKIKQLDDAVKAIDKEISSLQDELTAFTEKRDKARESVQHLRKQRDEGNTFFYQSRAILNRARDLAAKKDIKALEDLSNLEVDKFISLWSNDQSFRDDYERRILPSLDIRQLSRDGRIRNPDEKPLVVLEESPPSELETVAKANSKRAKEDVKPPQVDALPTQKAQKEVKNKPTNSKPVVDHTDVVEKEIAVSEKLPIETPKKDREVDAAKLKEIKREEEISKAKQAMERKKKLAEKAAAKAAIRAQKEAEKKNKEIITFICFFEREKKLKKKAAASAPDANPEDSAEPVADDVEPEMADETVEAPVPTKEKVQKETSIRSRTRARGPESIPKAILKRKKSINYWLWAGPAAAVVVVLLLLLLLAYHYLL